VVDLRLSRGPPKTQLPKMHSNSRLRRSQILKSADFDLRFVELSIAPRRRHTTHKKDNQSYSDIGLFRQHSLHDLIAIDENM